eukprot:g8765.t1
MSGSKTSEISGIEETFEQPQQNEKAKHQSVNIVTEIEEAPVEDSAPAENNSTGEVLSPKGPSSSSKSPFTKYPEIMDAVGEGETTKMADIIMKYMSEFEGTSHTEERIQNAWKIIDYCLQDSRAKDELYKQLMSQSRERENEDTKYNLWELWLIIVASFKPSKKRIRAVTDYIFWVSKELAVNEELEDLVKRVWSTFKRSTKIKQRIKPLKAIDIEVLLGITRFQTIISFIDGSTESVEYDPTMTVSDIVQTISKRINLKHFHTFTLFQVNTSSSEEDSWEMNEIDMIPLDQDQYITDIDPNALTSHLVFKKRFFCEQDAEIDDPVFINLCYLQARYEFLEGKYPVAQDDGAQLCALLIHATNGSSLEIEDVEFLYQISKSTPKTRIMDWQGEKWRKNVYMKYANLSELTQEETKSRFVKIICSMPYSTSLYDCYANNNPSLYSIGDSLEFEVETVEDPIGLFPYKLILGINEHGVHFFWLVPKAYLHSVELQDIPKFYSNTSSISIQMRMAGVIHVFEFETIQGGEICQALQTCVSGSAMNMMQTSLMNPHSKTTFLKEKPREFKDSMVPDPLPDRTLWKKSGRRPFGRFITDDTDMVKISFDEFDSSIDRTVTNSPDVFFDHHVTSLSDQSELQEYLTKVEQIKKYKESSHEVEQERKKILEKNRRIIEELQKRVKKEQEERKKNHNEIQDLQGKIRVYCRVWPFLESDGSQKQMNALSILSDTTITHKSTFPWAVPRDKDEKYVFHKVFAPEALQEEAFESVKYMIQSAVDGYNVCVIAYGQTGSGKTHTIMGSEENPGIARRAVHELFRIVERETENLFFEIQCSLLELYKDKFKDLLRPNEKVKVEVKQGRDGTVVCGAEKRNIASEQQLQDILEEGHKRRHTGSTKMNEVSSRSHMIISLFMKTTDLQTQRSSTGKINFVDLAGMERLKKSETFREQSEEARANNYSLSALQNVIKYLSEGHSSPPYRSNKLTHLLKEFIGGDSKTAMFVNVSPCLSDLKETKFALCYAQEMSVVKNDGTRGLMDEEASRLRERKFEWEERTDILSSYEEFL